MSNTYDDTAFCAETGNVIPFPRKEKAKSADDLLERMTVRLPTHIGPSFFDDAMNAELAALNARFAALDEGIPAPGDDL